MDYRSWHVGMKVVFVGVPGDAEPKIKPCVLIDDRVYTISDMHWVNPGDRLVIASGEVVEAESEGLYIRVGTPVWYLARAFRPVQHRKTDISIFTAMLTGAKERSKEPAHG